MSTLATKQKQKQYEFLNKTINKKELGNLLSDVYNQFGGAKAGYLANALKDLGFSYATKAGVTISIEDLTVPEAKVELLENAEKEIERAQHRFHKGEITEVERYTKVIDTWAQTTEDLTKAVVDTFDKLNPVYMMAFSGARGNISQVRQLIGMRGLMADSQGQIIDIPIKTNFKEGLSVTEYIISSYGARKGLVDTALKTADSGYLTRRLVDVAQDVIITEDDCGTQRGVMAEAIYEGDKCIVTLEERLIGRTSAENVVNADGEVLAPAGEIIEPTQAQAILDAGITQVKVRSGISCETEFGVCRQCYGWSLTNNRMVDVGEAIGIMAAQSIGEPGTQLTMRTFHTGGVFTGSNQTLEKVVAKEDGELSAEIPVRETRSRHGDIQQLATRDITVKVGKSSYSIPYGAFVNIMEKGAKVKKGDIIAEYEPVSRNSDSRRLTEKAAKDIKTELQGEVVFEDFDADEKRDRQGNITRTATRNGTIWVLDGEVYNLPSGSKCSVKSGDTAKEGQVLAETMVVSEHGGEVRIPENLITESIGSGKNKIEKVVSGKELTIIIASISPKNAKLEATKKEQLWKVGKGEETYVIKSPANTFVENNSIIAELIDDSNHVPTSGEIIYDDIEVDEQRILQKPGRLYFVPEEIHQVAKDITLKMVESGQEVEAGTEVVKGVVARIGGIVEVVEDNDIIQEVIIRPGKRYRVDNVSDLKVEDGTVVGPKTEVAPGVKTKEKSLITINFLMDNPDGADLDDVEDTSEYEYAEVIVRPVQEFEVAPYDVKVKFDATDKENIAVTPVTQLTYKDGDKVRHVEGAPLLRTSLVLQMAGHLSHLKGIVETNDENNLKIAVLENLTIRRESTGENTSKDNTQTQLLVKHGEFIDKRSPVVKTQVLATADGIVSLGQKTGEEGEDVRRIAIINDSHHRTVKVKSKPTVKKGQYIRMDDEIAKGEKLEFSGQVVSATEKEVKLRVGQPYLISVGAQLQVEGKALVQRGDLIATLIFERLKSGDIVQGLPRVEELLEARKSKEIAILAGYDATAEIQYEDDVPRLFLVSEEKGKEEITTPIGVNLLVEDGDAIKKGQPLTDGSVNPHDVLETLGVAAVRKHLVDEVQRVYRSQGVEIADKHLEIIVRQMTRKVKVEEAGDTTLLPGELLDEKEVTKEIKRITAEMSEPVLPTYYPVLLGITKASLNTESFISAASFQETTRVLTEAAIEGKTDILRGLKENVIIGRLIPAGTGFPPFTQARVERIEEMAAQSKFSARKPSAILEEIESMFGSPEVSEESLGDFVVHDDDIIVGDDETGAGMHIEEADGNDSFDDEE